MSRPMAELINNIPPDRDSNKLLIIANNFNVSVSKKDTGAGTSSGADKIKDKKPWDDDSFFTKMGKTLGLTPRSSEEERERTEEKEKKAERIRKEQHDALKKGFSNIGKTLKSMATDNPIVNFIKDHWGKILIGLALVFLKPEQMKKVWIGLVDLVKWFINGGGKKIFMGIYSFLKTIGGWIGNIVDFIMGKTDKEREKQKLDEMKKRGPSKGFLGIGAQTQDEFNAEIKKQEEIVKEADDKELKGGAGTITTIATLGFALFALLKPLSALKLVLWTIPKMLAKLLKLDVLGGKLFNPILTSVKGFGSKMLNGAKGILGMKPSYTRPHATPTELAFKKSHSGIGKSVLSSTSEVAGKGVAGETGKAALKTVAKEAGKEAVKTAGKKGLAKVALKGAGTLAAKATPGLGLLISGGMSVKRMFDGDFMGAGMELASGVASLAPGLGTAASIAIQTALIAKDAGVFAKEAVKTTEDAKTDSPITAKKTTTQRMIAKEPVIKGKPYSKRQLAAVSMGRQMGNNIPVTKEEEMGRAVLKKENASNLGPIVSPTAKIDNMNGLTTKNSALKGDGSTVIIDNSQKNSNNVTKSGGSGSTTVLAKRNVESGYRLTGSDYGKSFNGL
jgi:hypothetical protein